MTTALLIAFVAVACSPLAVALAALLLHRGEDERFAGDKVIYRS